MSAGISAIRVPATENHTATVIWLHGLGDTGRGWSFLAKYVAMPHVKWILPNAPPIPITLNGGLRMPGWFDIRSLGDVTARQDEDGMLKSVNMVHKLITEEVDSGIPADRIVVGGFSQGAGIALLAGYSCERKIAGVVGLSGWLPLHTKFPAMRADANLKTPCFMAHGEDDGVVKFQFGEMSYETLKKLGVDVEFHKIEDMAHEAQPDELNLLGAWLKTRLVANSVDDESKAAGPKGSGDETAVKGKV